MGSVRETALEAKSLVDVLASLTSEQKNEILAEIAKLLRQNKSKLIAVNQLDMESAKENGMNPVMLDRLALNESRIEGMAECTEEVIALPDPVGNVLSEWDNENGLHIQKVSVPFGVVGMIYEARPNVTVDAAVLSLKTANVSLLRGSSSALHSNSALVDVIQDALANCNLPRHLVQLVKEKGHEATHELMQLRGIVDLLIPRGSAKLIKSVVETSLVPVIETGSGNCHVYIHADADYQMAENIVLNAKVQRPSVCNAIEKVLVHKAWPKENLKKLVEALREKSVECRGCTRTAEIISDIKPASDDDWGTEYLDYVIAVKIVDSVDEAISHINEYGTKHSEAIVTEDLDAANSFMQKVDAAVVYHNASTRFSDGFVFGFGAEIGISTQKMHARGPMGLKELTSYKYVVRGYGEVRA